MKKECFLRAIGCGVYTPNFFLRHPEACNKAGREDLDRGKKPRARCVYAELFETNVTFRFAKVGCKHTAPRAYGARRDSFVALCCAPQNDARAVRRGSRNAL